jgi:Recombinase
MLSPTIQASGVQSLRGVARALTARGIKTARGGTWTAVQVSEILRRV